jgi:hypothetical protein
MQISFCDEFATWAEREYSRAMMEYKQLVDLWEEARWYHSEVASFHRWRSPWFVNFPGSAVEMYGQVHTDQDSYGKIYYYGPIEEAPLLPPLIVYSELKIARELCDAAHAQLSAAHDWAPDGAHYAELLHTGEGVRAYNLLSDQTRLNAKCSGASGADGTRLRECSELGGASEAREEAASTHVLG